MNRARREEPARMWLYLLRCADDSLYCGIALDPEQRLQVHNRGQGSRFVASRRPARLVYLEGPFPDRGQAQSREWAVKRLTRAAKERLVQSFFTAG